MNKNIKKEYSTICDLKKIKFSTEKLKHYSEALDSIYHAVCLDIDDTTTFSNDEEKKQIIDALSTLVSRNVIICFITGRGILNALDFINELKEGIKANNNEVKESQFKRWYCVTNNGYMLHYTDVLSKASFLENGINLVTSDIKTEYSDLKPKLREEILRFLADRISTPYEELLSASLNGSGENSLRFPVGLNDSSLINEDIIDGIRNIVNAYTTNSYGVNKGIYHKDKKTVIEVSMTTKGAAINWVEKYLGIPQNKMLRIGDQGGITGNDYEMLGCVCGFSVNSVSDSDMGCWPVIKCTDDNEKPQILKGVEGTVYLLNRLKIYPTICLEKPDRASYIPKLAFSEQINLKENNRNYAYYEQQLKRAFHEKDFFTDSSRGFIDRRTGGYVIFDSEYEMLRATNPNHILFQIYDYKLYLPKNTMDGNYIGNDNNKLRKYPLLKFAMHTDGGILLRGPFNYYYGLAYRNVDSSNVNGKFFVKYNDYKMHYFKTVIKALYASPHLDMKDSIARRVLLSIMDCIRDYLLIIINMFLQEKVHDEDALYIFSKSDKELYELFLLAKKNLVLMYRCLFQNCNSDFSNELLVFLREEIYPKAIAYKSHIKELPSDFNYKKACRVWREIDSFYENVIAIDTSIGKLYEDMTISDKELIFYGIRYGSIELPIIAAMLIDVKSSYKGVKYSIGSLCLKSNYKKNHTGEIDTTRKLRTVKNRRFSHKNTCIHILMDDNLVTGRTIQIATNMLINKGIYPHRVFVVRYPAINRIEQMFLKNHAAPDTDLFWEFVYGLTSPTPYTKLYCPNLFSDRPEDKYLDALGRFNKTRIYVTELLYKNGIYSPDSEIKTEVRM